MTNKERNSFLLLSAVVTGQGFVYFIYKDFMQVETSFGLRSHPFSASLLHMHILLVPILVFCFGYLYKVHIQKKLKNANRRISGLITLTLFLAMIISGYLLQMGFELSVTKILGKIHLVISLVWFFACLWHSNNLIRGSKILKS